MSLHVFLKEYKLQFKYPFGVSSNTRKETPSVFVMLEENGIKAYGEACLPVYLGETVEATLNFLSKVKLVLNQCNTSGDLNEILNTIDQIEEGHHAAKAAVDMALHDLYAKREGKSLKAYLSIPHVPPMPTSITIGIDTEEVIKQKISEASDFKILKIKAGTKEDKQLLTMIRRYTDKPLYVDVNQGWTDKYYVLEMAKWMRDLNVILLEQPMPVVMHREMAWVTERCPLLTIADESVKRYSDLEQMNGAFSGINIKLMKCTGLAEARRMIEFCKKKEIKILLGCMAESSCATTAMAQLMGLADYIDLDAPLLYTNDPFSGISYDKGKLILPDLLGIGAEPKHPDFFKEPVF